MTPWIWGHPDVSYKLRYDNRQPEHHQHLDHTAPEVFAGMSGIFL